MKIIIKETGATETLSIIDPVSGVDYIADFVGNTGAFIDGQFFDNDNDELSCTQDTFDWWSRVVDENQELNYRIQDLIKEHGQDAIYDAIAGAGDVDLGDSAGSINQALDEFLATKGE